jgi:hypothetical protein
MKVYIVVYDPSYQTNDGYCKTMAVFDSADSASAYIWDWDNRGKWIDEGLDLDAFYWMEKEVMGE